MIRKILQPKVLGIIIATIALGIFFVGASIVTTASAAGQVPDWVKNNAGWWADGLISTDEFLDGTEFLIGQEVIKVPGFVQVAEAEDGDQATEAEGVDQAIIDDLWTAINNNQFQIDSIQTSGGEQEDSGILQTYVRTKSQDTIEFEKEFSIEVNCDPGDLAINGGAISSHYDISIIGDHPGKSNTLQDGDNPNSWSIYFTNNQGIDGWENAYVLCADTTP